MTLGDSGECCAVLVQGSERIKFSIWLDGKSVYPDPDVFSARTDWSAADVRALMGAGKYFLLAAHGLGS